MSSSGRYPITPTESALLNPRSSELTRVLIEGGGWRGSARKEAHVREYGRSRE
jgi:hypothetical protein